MNASASIGVVYLLRQADGLELARRFVESYRRCPAGMQHFLIILYKGFAQRHELEEARAIFRGLPHRGLEVEDTGFDIGSYLAAANRLSHDYLLFFNAHSQILAPGWLEVIATHGTRPGVGIAGTMGSYESLRDSMELIQRVLWMSLNKLKEYDWRVHEYYGALVEEYSPDPVPPPWSGGRDTSEEARQRWQAHDRFFRKHWRKLLEPDQLFAEFARFPEFPNPHIRTNGFMLRRERLLGCDPGEIRTKMDACAFESGTDGLTSRLRREGLAAIVVGRDGAGFDVADWPNSATFRLGEQANLLVSDNQSRAFLRMPPPQREVHVRMSWGDRLAPPRPAYPDIGLRFESTAAAPAL